MSYSGAMYSYFPRTLPSVLLATGLGEFGPTKAGSEARRRSPHGHPLSAARSPHPFAHANPLKSRLAHHSHWV